MMEAINSVVQAQQQQMSTQLQVAVLKESLNMQKTVGNAVLSLMDTAMPAGKSVDSGQNIDLFA